MAFNCAMVIMFVGDGPRGECLLLGPCTTNSSASESLWGVVVEGSVRSSLDGEALTLAAVVGVDAS